MQKNPKRHLMWLIHNVNHSSQIHEQTLEINGECIDLCLAAYSDAKDYSPLINDWIEEKTVRPGHWISAKDPIPMKCLFLFTKNSISGENERALADAVSLALKITLPPPSYISHAAQWIESAVITVPTWDAIPNPNAVSSKVFDRSSFETMVSLAARLNAGGRNRYPYFHEILKIASINETLIEVLSLWAFVEGFWHEGGGESDLSRSFMRMLTNDLYPGTAKKDPKVQVLKRKFLAQNEIIGARTFSELRNIVAHGSNLDLEGKWTNSQWRAIRDQRDLLLDTILHALVEYNLREA